MAYFSMTQITGFGQRWGAEMFQARSDISSKTSVSPAKYTVRVPSTT